MSRERSQFATIRRLTPTMLELTFPCSLHGEHKAMIVSDDAVAEVIAGFIAQFVFEHGYSRLYDLAADWDEMPF